MYPVLTIGPATRCDEIEDFAAILRILEAAKAIAGPSLVSRLHVNLKVRSQTKIESLSYIHSMIYSLYSSCCM